MDKLQIINRDGQLLVDSREVAEMVGKEHGHLLRDIKNYMEVLGKSNFGLADFFIEDTYTDGQGKPRPCYLITRKGCDMVANKMTGEKGVLFTAAYVTRFEEMEKKLYQVHVPQTLPEALRAYADEVERRELAENKLAIAEPKAEKHDKFINASSLQGIKEVGKVLGIGQKKFFEFLRQVKILDGKNLPMQDYLNRGWFEVKEATIGHGEDDAAFNVVVTKVTPIGLSALSDVVEKYGGADTLNDLKVKEVAGYVRAKQM
ncbi:anti-repressor protein [Aneurinibacillus soli]|uniref:Phage regulatory protein Rha n=1 Tax=Aneurinibacillus soli TaxID=1500254 RepID=A0A0U5B9I2_9BACL|nr:Rha family transcriptional regulator [Aneurinibacillus soli]PYE64297.1 anti-repressor protein [Aneurinibacillus soli]BAU28246.1 Phage regulatory protein Rha [Aneurinibacillus soli]